MRPAQGWMAVIVAAGWLLPGVAAGDASQSAMAETLFREGRRLMDEKRYDEGCPKLAESHKLDAATGTLLALALCHEGQGKIASAWAEYTDAAARARSEGNKDREQAAKERAAALEPKLSRLTIRVSPEASSVPGLDVKRDGLPQAQATWGIAIPVDPGDHVVEASAPGRRPLRMAVKIGAEADSKQALVPALEPSSEPAPAAVTPPAGPVAPVVPEPAPADKAGASGLRTTGWIVGGLGVVGLGLGSAFALHAMSRNSDSKADCSGDACGPRGFSDRTDAVTAGNRATVGFVIGGVLVAGGLTLVLLGGPQKRGVSLQASPALGWDSVGFVMKGRL